MIKLLVGLGNPGPQYLRTRHNAGFWFLEGLAAESLVSWQSASRFQGLLASFIIAEKKKWLLKPETYMNRSGQSVAKLASYYGIEADEILVIHDELDFEPGVVKLKKGGGHAGHNGLRDIIACLGSKDFYRLRIGIGRPPGRQAVSDYVLSAPSVEDRERILIGFKPVYKELDRLLAGEVEQVMTALHSKQA